MKEMIDLYKEFNTIFSLIHERISIKTTRGTIKSTL